MAKRVYFGFHYQNDIVRVNQVRNSDITKKDRESAGFYDNSLWEKAKKTGDDAIKKMILDGLEGSSVTVFLLGKDTAWRKWVRYELEESWKRGNGLLAIHINNLKNFSSEVSPRGDNILNTFNVEVSGQKTQLSNWFKTYDWILNYGYRDFGVWVEEAATIAAQLKTKGIMPNP